MIQEIPYKYDPAYKDKKPELTDYLLHYEYNKVMLLKEKEGYVIHLSGSSFRRRLPGKGVLSVFHR